VTETSAAPDSPRPFTFEIVAHDRETRARAGHFHTPHGAISTPVFMPVGTQATVKAVSSDELEAAGAQIILANTYHLYLRPGSARVARLGGLHRFMGWDRPILTDSGGFQVFSLAGGAEREGLVEVDEEGVTFRSHLDGGVHRFTPELAIEVQAELGADVVMAFDQCSTTEASYEASRDGMERTHRWAERCRARWRELEAAKLEAMPQALFGIVQGGPYEDLRRESARAIAGLDLPGIAIGGESIGYSKALTRQILDWLVDLLPSDLPRYAMGVGDPVDFFAVVERGIDMFDSVLPTRMARNGTLLTADGRLRVVNAQFAADTRPPESGCDCYTCQRFSRSYLRHLFKAEVLLAYRLATIHNLRFCLRTVDRIRESIQGGSFLSLRDEFLARYGSAGSGR
jgi:queuine tRNA-ribosyltransferase